MIDSVLMTVVPTLKTTSTSPARTAGMMKLPSVDEMTVMAISIDSMCTFIVASIWEPPNETTEAGCATNAKPSLMAGTAAAAVVVVTEVVEVASVDSDSSSATTSESESVSEVLLDDETDDPTDDVGAAGSSSAGLLLGLPELQDSSTAPLMKQTKFRQL